MPPRLDDQKQPADHPTGSLPGAAARHKWLLPNDLQLYSFPLPWVLALHVLFVHRRLTRFVTSFPCPLVATRGRYLVESQHQVLFPEKPQRQAEEPQRR